jgi:hypothetical protein
VLGVGRGNIQKAMDQQIQLDIAKDAFWITSKQISPIAKDVIRRLA